MEITNTSARKMITFKEQGRKFTYRVAGIVFHNGHVLFQRSTKDPKEVFGFLPGGRAELGESAEATLKREMLEELGVEATVERLVFVVENLFTEEGHAHHEINFQFLMHFPDDCYLYQGDTTFERHADDEELPMIFDWLPVAQLEQLAVYPTFLKQQLQQLPEQTTHILQINQV
ncbi:NUDIX hydrolase [Tengunoibacter tsumagoiensis]|uniref:DNA mismatch repair protein MutT n=1 Tax=Tengunoibacter tsumagoiensis TaxID=2014871 RepID=A0A401ZUM2_9CHLR|nr:NUDIX hydrolase [Tengunoibacter tsumagoiensis]GCE10430.1 DNA mismatch repair protein MutT [Tengunoibacter tsumagoiensis]